MGQKQQHFPSFNSASNCKHHKAHLCVRPKISWPINIWANHEPTPPGPPLPQLRYHLASPPHLLSSPSFPNCRCLPPGSSFLRAWPPWRSLWRGPSRASPWRPPPPPSCAATASRSPSAAAAAPWACRCRRGGSPSRWRTRRGPGAPRTDETPRDSASGSRYTATRSPSPGPSSSGSAAPGSCPLLLLPSIPFPVTALLPLLFGLVTQPRLLSAWILDTNLLTGSAG